MRKIRQHKNKSFKNLALVSMFIGGGLLSIANPTPGINLGNSTSTAIGEGSLATGSGTTAVGANTFASGNNMSREEYERFLAENKARLKEIEDKMKEVASARGDLSKLETEHQDIANKLRTIETYRNQITEKERLLNEKEPILTREIEVKKGEKVSYRTQIKDLERRLNIINSLDFDSLDQNHLDEGIARLAQELKTKMEQDATFLGEYGATGLPLSQYEASIRAIIATEKYKNPGNWYIKPYFESSDNLAITNNDNIKGRFVLHEGNIRLLDVNKIELINNIIKSTENKYDLSDDERQNLIKQKLKEHNLNFDNNDLNEILDGNLRRFNKIKGIGVLSEEDTKKIGNGLLIFNGIVYGGGQPLINPPQNEDEKRDWAVVGYINELFGHKYTYDTTTSQYSHVYEKNQYYNNRTLGNDTMIRIDVVKLYKEIQKSFENILSNEELTEMNRLNGSDNTNLSDVEILKKISLNKKYNNNEKRIFDENTTIEKYNKWKELVDMPLSYERFLNIIKDVENHPNSDFSEEITYKTMFSDTFREMRYNYLKSIDINDFVEKQKGLKAREDAVKLIKVYNDEIERIKTLEKETQDQITVKENEIAGYRSDITNLTNLLNSENPGNIDEVARQINEKKELIANKEKEIATLKTTITNISDGENALANGTNSRALGKASMSIGTNNYTNQESSIALGTNNTVNGEKSIAIGYGHNIQGSRNATLGDPNTIYGNDNFVLGNNITLGSEQNPVNNNLVFGSNINIQNVSNAIVLGNGSEAVENAVSVGKTGAERKIVNVADGLISETSKEAINGSQLYKFSMLLDDRLSKLNFAADIANALAIAGIPQVSGNKLFSLGAGTGYNAGQSAIALGISGQTPNKMFIFKVSGAVNLKKGYSVSAGVNINFGDIEDTTNKKLEREVLELRNKLKDIKVTNITEVNGKNYDGDITKLENQNKDLVKSNESLLNAIKYLKNELDSLKTQKETNKTNIAEQPVIQHIILDNFDFDKYDLKREHLSELGKLDYNSIKNVVIIGHADERGSDEYNQKLSENRAKTVRDFIKDLNNKIDIYYLGKGKSELISTDQAKNRRVEIIIK